MDASGRHIATNNAPCCPHSIAGWAEFVMHPHGPLQRILLVAAGMRGSWTTGRTDMGCADA